MSEARPAGRPNGARGPALAAELGSRLADLVDDPETFVHALRDGLAELADPAYAVMPAHRSPASGPVLGVRQPLLRAVEAPLVAALGQGSSSSALWLAQRLVGEGTRELRGFAVPALRRSLPDDPERTWQLLRRLGRDARDWVEVDGQAGTWAKGLLAEPFRWSEIEQLAYSERPMERRLAASVLATLPHEVPSRARSARLLPLMPRALELIRSLIGDAEDLVQKALAWALRTWARVDREAVEGLLGTEARLAVASGDGNRAVVIRATLPAISPSTAARLRGELLGVRRRPGARSTSRAAAALAASGLPVGLADLVTGRQGMRYGGAGA